MKILSSVLSLLFLVTLAAGARAETKVTLSKMHLCCGACVKGVEKAVDGVDGASVAVDQDNGSATVTASDAKTAKQALAAIAAAGFHASTDSETLKMPANSGVTKGKVTRLELVGIHNCCGGCNRAVKQAIASVGGVTADNAKPKAKSLVVEGNFDGLELINALYAAGFHVTKKK